MSSRRPLTIIACAVAALAIPSAAGAHGEKPVTHSDAPELIKNLTDQEQSGMRLRAASARPTWCGTERTTDGPGSPAEAHVKVVYAYPSDRPNRMRQWAPLLQGNVQAIRETYAATSGGQLTVRFDMGTDCGPQYADIATVALPLPASSYTGGGGQGRIDLVQNAIRAQVPSEGRTVNHLVFVDNVAQGGCDCLRGSALSYTDSKPNATIHDRGGLLGAVFGVDGWDPPSGSGTYFAMLFTHEMTHTFGAVQPDAPHATPYGHCADEWDVMCYDDGAGIRMTERCSENERGAITQLLDCGGDDYFNMNPAPGSYLATHWNVARSSFLEPAPAGLGTTPAPLVDEPTDAAPLPVSKVTARLRPGRGKAELIRYADRFVVRVKNVRLRGATRLRACLRTTAGVRCRVASRGRRSLTFRVANAATANVRASVQLRSRSRSVARTSGALTLSSAS